MSHITISKLVTALVVLSAILVPVASAQPIDPPGVGPMAVAESRDQGPLAVDSGSGSTSPVSGSFDWGDAVVGAAGVLTVLSAGLIGIVIVRRTRGRSRPLVTS